MDSCVHLHKILQLLPIGNAFAVLSNPEKRLRYDEFGSDQDYVSTGQARHYNYYTEFEADITPEEIFNVFFGGHFPTGNIHMFSNVARDAHYYPRRHRNERVWTHEQEEEENRPQNSYSAFIQLMPVFIIIIVSVITQLMATNPPYSLFYKSSVGHVISRETENLQVPYYVDKNFEKNYQGAELQELEKTVEKDYIDYIQTSCWKEKQQMVCKEKDSCFLLECNRQCLIRKSRVPASGEHLSSSQLSLLSEGLHPVLV
ncbi:dnaJ homolog subfamily C member 18 isoform X3 [Falco peregrinus]|uniref:dnaJ homolog subfamily C member 18 isoform X3 n=1 Tax=Falco peregrinus TaxID=8954 RepID=UPI00247A1CBE|nr:dnaJ homolog subfamily C member 18 isoform X3 [Falco peregrinus]XP_055667584.1 dnaJ homolog subfamily C member 18 isoform X3 [Falco peregrinus]